MLTLREQHERAGVSLFELADRSGIPLGQIVRELRIRAGLSQTELSKCSGISLEQVKKIESGKVTRPRPSTLHMLDRVLGQVPVILHGGLNGAAFDPRRHVNRRGGGTPVVEIWRPPKGALIRFVPLRETILCGTIQGPLADLTVTHVYRYTRAECDRVVEALYRFPLPGDAAVLGVRVRFGETTIETELQQRAEAERRYKEARRSGRQAALTTREAADVFTLQLTGLRPDEDVTVETHYVQVAEPRGAGWQLRVPLTTAPRYTRPDESPRAHQAQPLQVWRDPCHRFGLDLRLDEAATVTSPTHVLAVEAPEGAGLQVALCGGTVVPDRDLVLRWEPVRAEAPILRALVHEEPSEGQRYILALVTPTADGPETPTVSRDVTLLVDRSGSMSGPKWAAAAWAVGRFLAQLAPTDHFNVGLFDHTCVWLSPDPVPATPEFLERARRLVEQNGPRGGTELGPALEQALLQPRPAGPQSRRLLVLTDGQVTDNARLLRLVQEDSERPDRRRVSLLCIDAAPNSYLVTRLAEEGGGLAAYLTSDPDQDDITAALGEILALWERPVAVDVRLDVVTRAGARPGQAVHETVSTIELGDLPTGGSLWATGAVSISAEGVLRLRAGDRVLAELPLPVGEANTARPAVRALFGARQLARLEQLREAGLSTEDCDVLLDRLGYANDPARVRRRAAVYPETAALMRRDAVERILVRESMRFGLVCSLTAFVGVRKEAGQRVESTVEVPNALPAGWDDAFLTGQLADPFMATRGALAPCAVSIHTDRASVREAPPLRRPSRTDAAFSLFEEFEGEVLSGAPVAPKPALIFEGMPGLAHGRAVLLEAGDEAPSILSRIEVEVADGRVDAELALWVCVGDPNTPRVEMRLADLLALGGVRPLNLRRRPGERVWVVLHDPRGVWANGAPHLRVALG